MSATTKEGKSSIEKLLEGMPFRDIGNATVLAPETLLTREAAVHLRAASMELDHAYADVQALLATVRRELNNPVVGEDLTIDEDRAYDLTLILDQALDLIRERIVLAVFERGCGERPHGGIVESGTPD